MTVPKFSVVFRRFRIPIQPIRELHSELSTSHFPQHCGPNVRRFFDFQPIEKSIDGFSVASFVTGRESRDEPAKSRLFDPFLCLHNECIDSNWERTIFRLNSMLMK
jgi:hypothetical protein